MSPVTRGGCDRPHRQTTRRDNDHHFTDQANDREREQHKRDAPDDQGKDRAPRRWHEKGIRRQHWRAPALPQRRVLYEQITGGCVRVVRPNVTLPAVESNLAVLGPMNNSVPFWKGLPQPAGGFPLPSDNGCLARHNVPSILAHLMPQCV
ncbi:MAG: hypothetical protein ACJ780_24220 [Solirubrobacteraceae bacterium]